MTLFTEITYTRDEKKLKATDFLLVRAWEILCEKHVGKLSADAIRAFLSVSDSTTINTTSLVANQLDNVFDFGIEAAGIFPEEYPNWASEMTSLCERDSRGDFSLTFTGEVMKGKMMAELNKKHEQELARISSNKHLHPLEI